jgi:cytidylate kinase
MMGKMRIAIDGPSGAGKSTMAKLLAGKLKLDYIDTGAMYRAVGLKMSREGLNMSDEDREKRIELLDSTDIDFEDGKVTLDGEDVSGLIRTPEISKLASDFSSLAEVREKLVKIQRGIGERKSVVMDGRDIGTNVFKDAEIKFYLTATAEERAKRRFKELTEKGKDVSYEDTLSDIKKRDHNDSHRKLNPLKKADDAIEIDTTLMTIDEVVGKMIDEIKEKGLI